MRIENEIFEKEKEENLKMMSNSYDWLLSYVGYLLHSAQYK